MSGRKNSIVKIISLIIIYVYLFANIVFAAPAQFTENLPNKPDIATNPDSIIIPQQAGTIRSKFNGPAGRMVIHIQDAHCNYEAQSNIVRILEDLITNYNISLISVEGADGFIDTAWFRSFPDEAVRKEVATYFMRKGEITGPEYLSITSNYRIKLFGAETRSYYIENLNAFLSAYSLRTETERYYKSLKGCLVRLKGYVYNEDLKALDTESERYSSKGIQFNDHAKFLRSMAEKHKIDLRGYDNFSRLTNMLMREKGTDLNAAAKERSELIEELTKRITGPALAELVNRSLALKAGKISSSEYHSYLANLAETNGIEVSKRYPNLYNYMVSVETQSKIDNEKLFDEIKAIELAVRERLFENDEQKTLDKLYRHIDILLGLIDIKLLAADFNYYETHKAEFSCEAFTDYIKKGYAKYALAYDLEAPAGAVKDSIPKFEEFYRIAIKRDKVLIENTLEAMNKENQRMAVLITGGFHSEGIAKLLEHQGISYMVICPSITKDIPTPYLQILTNQKTSFNDILAGASEPTEGVLAPILISKFVGLSGQAIRTYFLSARSSVDIAHLRKLADAVADRVSNIKAAWPVAYDRFCERKAR